MATINELREKLTGRINRVERIDLLEEMLLILEEEEDRTLYILNTDQKNAVTEALNQYKNGQYLSEEDADKDINKWLEK
jgi:hypothetical protein